MIVTLKRTMRRHWPIGVLLGLVLTVFVGMPGLGFVSVLMQESLLSLRFSPSQTNAVLETTQLLLGVGVLSSAIGAGCAWLVSVYEFPLRRPLMLALMLPLAFPTYLAAYIAVDLLHFFGPVQTFWRWTIGAKNAQDYAFFEMRSLKGAVILLSLVLFPYIYVPCRILFSRSGRNIIDAARLLGVSGGALFWRVGLPIARPALLAGLVLVLLEALNDIGATEYLGVSSLSVVIRDLWLNRGDLGGAARLAVILAIAVALLLLIDPANRTGPPVQAGMRGQAEPTRIRLQGNRAVLASTLCMVPVLLGFVVPAAFLLVRAFSYSVLGRLELAFFTAGATSLMLALATSVVVMATGGLVAIALRILPRLRALSVLTIIGYATPGTVIALAILPVIRAGDDTLAALGSSILIASSSLIVVYALSVRFLGIGTSQANVALARLPMNVDAVARVHGVRDLNLALRVHLPAILPGLMLAGALVFIDAIKELPITILLRPLNIDTLASRAYSLANVGLFEHAALESLSIVAFSAVATHMLAKRM